MFNSNKKRLEAYDKEQQQNADLVDSCQRFILQYKEFEKTQGATFDFWAATFELDCIKNHMLELNKNSIDFGSYTFVINGDSIELTENGD